MVALLAHAAAAAAAPGVSAMVAVWRKKEGAGYMFDYIYVLKLQTKVFPHLLSLIGIIWRSGPVFIQYDDFTETEYRH